MYMPEYYAEKDQEKLAEWTAKVVKHNDEHWSLDKYQIYFDIDDLGFNDYTVLYKDHGVQVVAKSLEEAVNEIMLLETWDPGEPE